MACPRIACMLARISTDAALPAVGAVAFRRARCPRGGGPAGAVRHVRPGRAGGGTPVAVAGLVIEQLPYRRVCQGVSATARRYQSPKTSATTVTMTCSLGTLPAAVTFALASRQGDDLPGPAKR